MSEYIRMLSYIYSYEDGRRNKNVGFAKMDGRDGIVRLLINIRDGYRNDMRQMRLYFYRQNEAEIVPLPVGELRLVNGCCEYRTQMNAKDVVDSIGLYIATYDNEEQEKLEYASYFKDTNAGIDFFREKINEKTNISDDKEPIDNIESESDEPQLEAESITQETTDFWEILSRKYPKCRVLGNDYECIRIRAEDIESLPKAYHKLVRNSFLLHGYYFYRHLILSKGNSGFYIGVPGYYQKNEQIAATMFGFDKFLRSSENNPDGPGFGYWLMDLTDL